MIHKIYYHVKPGEKKKNKIKIHHIVEHTNDTAVEQQEKEAALKKIIYSDKRTGTIDFHSMGKLYTKKELHDINSAVEKNINDKINVLFYNIYSFMRNEFNNMNA